MNEFEKILTRNSFPMHLPTYRAALQGHPFPGSDGWLRPPMKEEDAILIARVVLFNMARDKQEELKNV